MLDFVFLKLVHLKFIGKFLNIAKVIAGPAHCHSIGPAWKMTLGRHPHVRHAAAHLIPCTAAGRSKIPFPRFVLPISPFALHRRAAPRFQPTSLSRAASVAAGWAPPSHQSRLLLHAIVAKPDRSPCCLPRAPPSSFLHGEGLIDGSCLQPWTVSVVTIVSSTTAPHWSPTHPTTSLTPCHQSLSLIHRCRERPPTVSLYPLRAPEVAQHVVGML
jgi:hypothetical protein